MGEQQAARSQNGNPISCAVSWQCSPGPGSKIEHCSLNSHPFVVAFSGIDRGWDLVYGAYFFVFYFEHFCGRYFRTGQ